MTDETLAADPRCAGPGAVATAVPRRRRGLLSTLLAALTGLAAGLVAASGPARADAASDRWVQSFWSHAQAAGISRQVYDAALAGFEPDTSIISTASSQAEFVRPIWQYMDNMVSPERLQLGQAKIASVMPLLQRIETQYGVDRFTLLAIWGMESTYGAMLSNQRLIRPAIRSLATLAYIGGSRRAYGEQQLIAALKILQRGDITLAGMTGSWAGAMGHTQFIPTTYEEFAVDYDGDGKRNIWTSEADALASAANYLRASGWETGKTWGYEVVVPQSGFDYRLAEEAQARPIGEWAAMGITRPGGAAFPRPEDVAHLLMPSGARGPGFLLLKNFRVIKRYNNADSYALAVGHLADRLRGGAPFRQAWPTDELPLNREQRAELQELLTRLGHYNGEIDARLGPMSRVAIRTFQQQTGLAPDGFASVRLLERMRSASR